MRVTNLACAGLLAAASGLAQAQADGEAASAAAAPESAAPEAPAQTTPTVAVDAPEAAAPAPAAAAPSSDNRFVQEVVVTAQKREEKLQDVPISVQAFGGELLDAMGVTDQTDLQRVTPGLNISSQVSYVITFLRGVGTDAAIAADPSVATYIDGIYYPFASNLAQNFGAVDRIEVLKGPQGTLFGRNATGGAISIYTREPDFDSVSGELNASIGSFGTKKSRAYFNVPLTDWLAFNVSAIASESSGFYHGTRGIPAVGFPKDKEVGARLKVRIQPTENLDIHLAGLIHELHGGAANISFNSAPSTLGTLMGIQPQTGYRGSIDSYAYTQTNPNRVFYGNATYHAPWFDVKLLGSKQYMDTAGIRDFDGSPRAISTFNTPKQFIDAESAELQILSNDEVSPEWLQWIVGGYYYHGVSGFQSLKFTINGIDLTAGSIAGIDLPDGLISFLRGLPLAPSGRLDLVGLSGTNSLATFGQTNIKPTDWFDITLGLRYQEEKKYVAESRVGLDNADGSITNVVDNSDRASSEGGDFPATETTYSTSPKVSLQFHPFGEDVLLYTSWQKALKAGTYNTVGIYDAPDYVKPERIEAYEVGAKTTLLGGLARLNAAAFHYDVTNLQSAFVSLLAGGVIAFENAGAAKIEGFDFDGLVQVLPSHVDDLVVTGGLAYLRARYEDFDDGSGFDDAGFFSTDMDFTGNSVVRSPKVSGSLSVAKTWAMPGGPLETALDTYYSGHFFYEPSNRDVTRQDAYWLLGARVSYLVEAWGLRATFAVQNLTDERYTSGMFVTDYGVQPDKAAPRYYEFQLAFTF